MLHLGWQGSSRCGCGPPARTPAGRWGTPAGSGAGMVPGAGPILRQKAPILRRADEGEPLDAVGKERALAGAYRPARGPEEPVCGVLRRDGDGEQRLPVPVCTVIPGSRDRLPLAELVRAAPRPAGAGACVPGAAEGPGLHPPPCRPHAAHQGFYLGARIAQLLLRRRPDQVLPDEARQPGLRPLIRYCVGSVGRRMRSARRLRLLCSRSNLRWDWLLHAASRRESG